MDSLKWRRWLSNFFFNCDTTQYKNTLTKKKKKVSLNNILFVCNSWDFLFQLKFDLEKNSGLRNYLNDFSSYQKKFFQWVWTGGARREKKVLIW